jgi:S-adenosylmethionine:tRNA ribosyltransferase-isomerase
MQPEINIANFTYELNNEKIAKYPVEPRDSSKLLLYKKGIISHHGFNQLSQLLPKNTCLVFNNTKVIPARLYLKRESGAQIEVFLLSPVLPNADINLAMQAKNFSTWQCVVGNKKKWKVDEKLVSKLKIENDEIDLTISWLDLEKNVVAFNWSHDFVFSQIVEAIGKIPLPPYLNRPPETSDIDNYQTVYSEKKGAVAAPTAGLHFTNAIFEDLEKNDIKKTFLTLHVGAGTFMPVKTVNALDHPMHNEQLHFTIDQITNLLLNIDQIIPVGTTSMRSVESLYWFGVMIIMAKKDIPDFFIEKLYPYQFETDISAKTSFDISWVSI